MKKHRTWAEINLGCLARNLEHVRHHAGPGAKVLVVVKADAYGHGAVPLARTALESGAAMVGVGDSNEAIHLREAGVLAPILILGALIEEEIGWVVSYDIIPTIHSLDMVDLLEQEARRQGKRVPVHLKVDTGMARLGASPSRAVEIAQRVGQSSHLVLDGVSSHFASLNTEDVVSGHVQLERFREVLDALAREGIRPRYIHIANTAGIHLIPECRFNLVRVGGAIYGIDTHALRPDRFPYEPILSMKSQVTFLKGVRAGTPVGYGGTYVAARDTMLATIPVGYNDGYPWRLSNQGQVLIRGSFAPVAGRVTMDYLMADVGQIPEVAVGDEVVLIGRQGDHRIRVEDLARIAGTIPYEITCSLGRRVRRVYVGESEA